MYVGCCVGHCMYDVVWDIVCMLDVVWDIVCMMLCGTLYVFGMLCGTLAVLLIVACDMQTIFYTNR